MSSLYQVTGQMLVDLAGEDAGVRIDYRQVSQEIVNLIVREIKEHGFPSVDQAAAHDGPATHRGVAA